MAVNVNYACYYDRPEMIRVCEQCTKPECVEGICNDYKNALRAMLGLKQLSEKPPKLGQWREPKPRRIRPKNDVKRKYNSKQVFEYKGEMHTLKEWAELLNIDYNTLYMRLYRYKITFAEAVEFVRVWNPDKIMTITANGETLTVREWAERLGVKPKTIYARIQRGYTPEQAVTYGRMV